MVFCFIIHVGKMNRMGGRGHKDTVQLTLAVSTYPCLCKVKLFFLLARHSTLCPSAKVVLRDLERFHRAHFEMWFQDWLPFYDCMFTT